MSERYVRGWSVDVPELATKLRGVTPKDVITAKANAKGKTDVFMTLGQGYDKEAQAEGKQIATTALESLLGGKKDEDLEYEYARVLELVLSYAGKQHAGEIRVALTYHAAPPDDDACWNTWLKKLKLTNLAKAWGAENLKYPWPRRAIGTGWPMWTEIPPKVLAKVKTELAAIERPQLDAIIDKKDVDYDVEPSETRDELWEGLQRLRDWVGKTKTGESLVLSMDGDQ